ncbi:MAG TPA: GNAT family N-acetyltransferase [Rhizomicrobium sp.]|nr:GNAT family N-acetyltransferase [Rhizomicrobium sp.]
MSEALRIAVEASDAEIENTIRTRLGAFNRTAVDKPERQHFNVVLRDCEGCMRGGLIASVNFDVMLIEDLFIEEAHRRGGHGAKLVALAEEEGRLRGARRACVSTFSWQARPFYEKLGFRVFGELPYCGGAHVLYWLDKSLCA